MAIVLRTARIRAGWYYSSDYRWQIKRTFPLFGGKVWVVSVRYYGHDYFTRCGHFPTLKAARAYIEERLDMSAQ